MPTMQEAMQKYPDWQWAMSVPGVKEELQRAIDDPAYDPIPAIMRTDWYRQTQASIRQWDALMARDPETANAKLREEQARLWDMHLQMGMTPDGKYIEETALKSLRMGWQQYQLQDYLASRFTYGTTPTNVPGKLSSTMTQIKQQAAQYFQSLSDETAFNYAKSIMAGEHTLEDWNGVWADQAQRQFPTIAGELAKGTTPAQYFAPIKDRIASQLEVAPSAINLMDSKWSPVIDHSDEQGNRRTMTLSEVDRFVRGQDEWKRTRQGQEAAANMAETLLQKFGKVAG